MKSSLLLLCLLCFACCEGQYRQRLKESSFDPEAFKEFPIELKKKKKEYPWVVDFNKVQFIDARADSSKLGFVLAGQFNEYHRVIFPKPAAAYLTDKMTEFYSGNTQTNENLTVVIKHLWVSERLVKAENGRDILIGPIDYLSFCYVNTDYYAEANGQYRFIGTIDTVISVRKWIVNAADDLIKKTLFNAINVANTFFKNRNNSENPLSRDMLLEKYKAEIDFPVLKADHVARGVFLNYTEFLNNSPSILEFEVVKKKKTETVKSSEAPDSILSKAWGYCDGNSVNIHMNNNYYRAVALQHTFEVAGPRDSAFLYSEEAMFLHATIAYFFKGLLGAGLTLFSMGGHNSIMKELVPYQLNIKEGTLY